MKLLSKTFPCEKVALLLKENQGITPMQEKRKVLVHLHRPFFPTDSGDTRRLIGVLNYFRLRSEHFAVDAFSKSPHRRSSSIWSATDRTNAIKFADNFFVYNAEGKWFDTIYSRSQSLYHQRLLRQQLPIDSDYHTPPGYIRFVKSLQRSNRFTHLWLNYTDNTHLGLALKAQDPTIKVFLDIHDLGTQTRLERRKSSPEQSPLNRLKFNYNLNLQREVSLIQRVDKVIVNSIDELEILKQFLPSEKLFLLPHLIENIETDKSSSYYLERSLQYDLLFVGSKGAFNVNAMNYFLDSIYPKILERRPNVRLTIAGNVSTAIEPNSIVRDNVELLGFVPDLKSLYLQSRVFICPLLSGMGTKVKLQEAMSYGLPIVTTSVGASGLKLTDHLNAFITDDPELFAQHTLELLCNSDLAQSFSSNISDVFQQHYSNEAVYQQLDQLFELNKQH